jgi:para-nitrobenzyl esterase
MSADITKAGACFVLPRTSAVLGMALLALAACSSTPGQKDKCKAGSPDLACTAQGAVRGTADGNTLAFKGIPYATPPVGDLRFQPPRPPVAWKGVRDASRFGDICPQLAGTEVVGKEDCLTLNVWRPKEAVREPLPVMVFLTGGGNHAFSGQGSPSFGGVNYNGRQLVPESVVYVSFNARLGALGYLAHPALSASQPEKVSGNYGSLDHIAMLKWIKENIASFGGDPERVMLFGTSAGGGNICALMTSPMTKGLFHRASLQSSVPTGCEIQTLTDAEQGTGQSVAQAVSCDKSSNVAACLRSKSMAEIVKAVPGTFGVLPRLYGPNVDGHVFPDQPLARIKRGEYMKMPIIVGDSTDETMMFVNAVGPVTDAASYGGAIDKLFGAAAGPGIRAQYPLSAYATPREAFVRLTTDALFTCQSRRVARTLSEVQDDPVYRYLFAHSLENDAQQKALGAVHTVEHMFFFPWQGSYRPTATDLKLQQMMVDYWTQMARSGRTGSTGGTAWPVYTRQNGAYLEFSPVLAAKAGPSTAHCEFWDTVKLPWPHL